jgi:catechol 2,3-dioxygenase-like lactoylglutathione lyase family enzyme
MRRIHIGLDVQDLDASIRFYSQLFGQEPEVIKADYAKWMVEDPRVNLSITARGGAGQVHFGIQVESREALAEAAERLRQAGQEVVSEEATTCCYHESDKAWVADPERFLWETFVTLGEATDYGEDGAAREALICCE